MKIWSLLSSSFSCYDVLRCSNLLQCPGGHLILEGEYVGVTPPPQSKSWSVTWYVATCRARGRETGQENKAVVSWLRLNLLCERGPTIALNEIGCGQNFYTTPELKMLFLACFRFVVQNVNISINIISVDNFLKFFSFIHNSIVNKWGGANKDAKIFICKVRDPAHSFVSSSYTMHELRNQHFSIGMFLYQ